MNIYPTIYIRLAKDKKDSVKILLPNILYKANYTQISLKISHCASESEMIEEMLKWKTGSVPD